jgi:hypothetical protein
LIVLGFGAGCKPASIGARGRPPRRAGRRPEGSLPAVGGLQPLDLLANQALGRLGNDPDDRLPQALRLEAIGQARDDLFDQGVGADGWGGREPGHRDVHERFYFAASVIETSRDYWKHIRSTTNVAEEREPHDITIDALQSFVNRVKDGKYENAGVSVFGTR